MAEPKEVESTATVLNDDEEDAESTVTSTAVDHEASEANVVCSASGASKSN